MATLRIDNGPQKGTKISLPTSGNFVVGSEPKTAQLVLVDSKVSRLHFALGIGAQGAVTLKDLGAPEGTLVNGKKVASAALRPGDRIQAGDTTLTFDPPAESTGGVNLSGQTIGGYRIEKLVGQGGMGKVYRAVQVSLDRVVALKVLPSQLVADRDFVELFFREARAAGKLNHPNVVQVYDVGEAGGIYFYSMEFMEGGTMEGRIQRDGKIPVDEAVAIVRDAARGLQFAESQKIVHRDIKPDNLMISMSGHAKIADLGLAAPHESAEPGKGKIFGTPHFISPEQAKGQSVDARSDLYSLGATFFRILTGKTPFNGKDVREILQKQIQQEAPRVRSLDPEIPEEVDEIIARLLQKDPAQRFQSAKELAEALESFLNPKAHGGPKVWLLAGVPLVLLAGAMLLWKPWEKKDPQIIEKFVERPDDPSKAAEAERLKKDIAEKAAHIEFQGVSGSAAPAARLAAYEQIAQKHPATEYGKIAKQEAAKIRQQIEEARLAEESRSARLAAFENRLRELVAPSLEGKRFREAAITVAAAPELAVPEPDAGDRETAEKIFQEIASAEEKTVSAWLQEAEQFLADSKFPESEAALAKVRDAITPLEGIPESLRPGFQQHAEFGEKLREKIASSRATLDRARFEADTASTHAALFAQASLAEEIGNLRFPSALEKVEALRAKAATPAYQGYLARWKAELEASERAMRALVSHVQSQDLTEKSIKNPLNGRTQPLLGASRADGVAVPDPAKRDAKLWIPWEKFHTPERIHELFRNRWAMKAEEAADAAQLLLLAGVALEAQEFAKSWSGAMNGKPAPTPPLFDSKPFQYAKELLEKAEGLGGSKERCAALRERLHAEEETATSFSRAFRHLLDRDFDAALREMETVRERHSSTFLFGLFTDGSTPLPARGF